jgi:signal peptide peptidase SppA
MTIRQVRAGEPLAIDPSFLRQSAGNGPQAFFWLFAPPIQETEYRDDGLAIVHVRGPLEHHDDPCSDSYDAIVARTEEAFACEEAKAVVLRIDSPGGVVSGLSSAVDRLRQCAKASGKRFVAYVDEMAASAAYALSCSCDEIILPKSAIVGSIGVISTMVDVTAADEAMGIRYVTIASGSKKTDGHPHVPITDTAVASEKRRVDKLALQFFKLVRQARGLPIKSIQGFQAGIFLGREGVTAGLADAVMTFDEACALLSEAAGNGPVQRAQAKPLAQPAESGSHSTQRSNSTHLSKQTHQVDPESKMTLALDALIKKTEAALASEKDAKRKAELAASLEAYKKTKHSIEKHETEEGEDDEEDEEDEDDAAAKGNETDRSDDPDEDEDDGDEEDEKKSSAERKQKREGLLQRAVARGKMTADAAKALSKAKLKDVKRALGIPAVPKPRAAAPAPTRPSATEELRRVAVAAGPAALGAFEGLMATSEETNKRVAALERANAATARDSVVRTALAANRITKKEAAGLFKKPIAHVEAFLEARPRGLVYSQSEDLPVPAMQNPDGSSVLPPELEAIVNQAVMASDGSVTREQFIKNYQADHGLNGTNGSGLNGAGRGGQV